MPSETPIRLKWRDLDGRQKYEVVELARRRGIAIKELCRTFGISRQTLYRAMDAADKAAIEALSPKPKGRPPVAPSRKEIQDLEQRNKALEQDLKQQKLKSEVAQALLDLQRKMDRGETLPGEKKGDQPAGRSRTTGSGCPRADRGMADGDDG